MGLSLNKIYQRPYVNPDGRSQVNKGDDEKNAANAQRENTGSNTKSKGLEYVEQQKPSYTPTYQGTYSYGAYSNVNVNSQANQAFQGQNNKQKQTPITDLNNQINIAQILKDFKNTAIAIGTPEELSQEVDQYIRLIEKHVQKGNPSAKLIKSNLAFAASLLDNHISETLNKNSKVVENWVDTLFLQKINFNYNEDDINERFLVKFPDGTTSQTKRQEELQETSQASAPVVSEGNDKVIPISVAQEAQTSKIPQDKELKSLFIKAKKYSYSKNPEMAIKTFEKALNRANEIDDTETSSKIYYEVGKIYDNHDYLAQALKSYNQSLKLSKDENVKTKAYYSMAQIYDEVNQITPALNHYVSAISHAGEAENLPAQSASLTKIGNIYSDMYEREAFNYYDIANDIANETKDNNLLGFVNSNTAKAHVKFDEPEKALKSYSQAVKNYTEGDSPVKTARNYMGAADIMVEFNNIGKAHTLLTKAQKYARQTDNVNLMNEINKKLSQLEALDVK